MDVADQRQKEFSAGRIDDQKYVCNSPGHKKFSVRFFIDLKPQPVLLIGCI